MDGIERLITPWCGVKYLAMLILASSSSKFKCFIKVSSHTTYITYKKHQFWFHNKDCVYVPLNNEL